MPSGTGEYNNKPAIIKSELVIKLEVDSSEGNNIYTDGRNDYQW